MQILFILGNGFDLNLGLKTSYQNFYDWYSKQDNTDSMIIKLKEHMKDNRYDYWSDLEIALGKYTVNYNSIDEFDRVNDDIVLSLSNYLASIEVDFSQYSINQQKFFNDLTYPEQYLIPTEEEHIHTFTDRYKHRSWQINIVTFNYTNIVEQITNDIEGEIGNRSFNNTNIPNFLNTPIHVHGFVKDRMILGVNDLSQVANENLHDDIDIQETIIKQQCNIANGEKADVYFNTKIAEANLICAFGLSFGDSDKIWWEKLGNKLKSDDCRLIIFDKKEDVSDIQKQKLSRLRRSIREHFLSQAGLTEEEKNIIKKKIFVAVNTNMFKDVKSEEEKNSVVDS